MQQRLTRGIAGAVPILALLVMLGCQGTTPLAEPTSPVPEPEPPAPVPTLQGTWAYEDTYVHDEDGRTYTEKQLVTFTGGGRAITDNAVYDDTGALVGTWQWGEGYATTDTAVTRKIPGDDEDPAREFVKTYYWGEDRSSVFMNPWGHEGETQELLRYTRAVDPLPDLVGTWTYRYEEDDEPTDREVTVTIGSDGSFVLDNELSEDYVWRLTGSIGPVDPETLMAPLSSLERTRLDGSGAVVDEARIWGDGTGRIGLAPGIDGAVVASPPWDERETEMHPYGSFWLRLTRAESDA